ncbi:MAG: DUF885 family protein [Fimbriimonas ginsengisoli]|nr:DUF885 family protein [Fimbriimonas ginsengisoli]
MERYVADRGNLTRFYTIDISPAREKRMRQFYGDTLAALDRVKFESLGVEGRADMVLFRNHLQHELRQLDLDSKVHSQIAPLIPFAKIAIGLEESRRHMETMNAEKAAGSLDNLTKQARAALVEAPKMKIDPIMANRAAAAINALRGTLKEWFGFYNGYDPAFTWWAAEPYKTADEAMQSYARFLRERVTGVKADDKTTIVGNPIGREAILSELAYEMIPYTPEELIEIANKEFAWCDADMKKASRDLGFGDDWKKAVEHVKTLHADPGKQPDVVRDLTFEAIDYVEKNGLVTVPPLAKETLRMEMMSAERQLLNPFFLGGPLIQVSYPTNTMTHEQKEMALRGNNIHFSRATVFHELIPGHNLQGFIAARSRPYRSLFRTPFMTEGWALYWEFLLWDMGFPKTPENRIGMLVWRMHRCARIIFSLSFHLGKMSPQECIDFLVDRVGFERENAAGEVRRSFEGNYSPLYQCAYMLGALQIRGLKRELVDSGKMTIRDFNDAYLRENSIPVEIGRAILKGTPLPRDFQPAWRFY